MRIERSRYMYIYRERERDSRIERPIYIYMYIYRERERPDRCVSSGLAGQFTCFTRTNVQNTVLISAQFTCFTCFTGTKVQILTLQLAAQALHAMLLAATSLRAYLLYWYKRTNTDAAAGGAGVACYAAGGDLFAADNKAVRALIEP